MIVLTKLICLKETIPASYGEHSLALTKGKVYETIPFDAGYYTHDTLKNRTETMWCVINDNGVKMDYSKDYDIFMTLAEWREKQMDLFLQEL